MKSYLEGALEPSLEFFSIIVQNVLPAASFGHVVIVPGQISNAPRMGKDELDAGFASCSLAGGCRATALHTW